MENFDAEALAQEFRSRVDALPERKVPLVRPIRREISRRIAKAAPPQVLELASLLIDLDMRGWAYEVVHFHRPTLRVAGRGHDREPRQWHRRLGFGRHPRRAACRPRLGERPDRRRGRAPLGAVSGPLVAAHRARRDNRPEREDQGRAGRCASHPRRLRDAGRRPRRHGREGNVMGAAGAGPVGTGRRRALPVRARRPVGRKNKARSPKQDQDRPQEPSQIVRRDMAELAVSKQFRLAMLL